MALVVLAAALLGAVTILVLERDGDDGGLARGRALLADDERFDTAYRAADTLARVGELLQRDGADCRRDDGRAARCGHLLAASAAAQVMAVRVLDCTGPGRFAARTSLRDHLDAIADGDDPGQPPAPPDCR